MGFLLRNWELLKVSLVHTSRVWDDAMGRW